MKMNIFKASVEPKDNKKQGNCVILHSYTLDQSMCRLAPRNRNISQFILEVVPRPAGGFEVGRFLCICHSSYRRHF